jgi:hypothetical protein
MLLGCRRGRRHFARRAAYLMEAVEARRMLAWAGPDGYGYEANEYPYEALDLQPGDAGVNSILDTDDDGFTSVSLGANSFKFYGTTYNNLILNVNGLITIGSSNEYYANSNLSSTPTERAIAPLWDDWRTDADTMVSGPLNDVVLYQIDSASNRLIVEWNAVRNISTGSSQFATFQAILQLNTGASDGSMTFNYVDLDLGNATISNGGAATVGIKDSGPQGANVVLVSLNSNGHPLVQSGAALRITKGPPTSTGSIAGQAFVDANLDGTLNGGETAVSGALVYLDLDNSGTLDAGEPSQTAAGGNYLFSGLADGTYHVRQTAPAGYVSTGSGISVVSNGSAVTSVDLPNIKTVYDGTAGNDNYLLRKKAGDATKYEILIENVLVYTLPTASASSLTFNLAGGDDVLTLDYANGNPVVSGGMLFDGGANATANGDALVVTGSASADTIDLYGIGGGSGVVAGGITVSTIERVTVNGGAGNDVLTVNPWVNAPIIFNGDADVDTLNYLGSNINEAISLTLVTPATANIHGEVNTVSFFSIPEQIVVDGLAGNDVLHVASVPAGVNVSLLGGSGDDQFTTGSGGSSDNIDGNVTFSGGGGLDQLMWNDYLVNTSGLIYTLTSTSLSRAGAGTMTLTQLASVNVMLGPATVTVNVTSTPTGRATTITGGNAADAINLGPNLDNLAGAVTFTDAFANDNDVITLNDSTNSFSQSYAVTSSAVSRSLFGGLTYSGAEGLALLCQSGNNTIALNAAVAFPPTTINGNGGTDALVITGSNTADTVTVTGTAIVTQNGTINYLGIESLTCNAGSGNDTLTISGAPSANATFNGGLLATDQDTLNVNAGTYTFATDARLTSTNLKLSVGSAGNVVFNSSQHLAGLIVLGKAAMSADGNRYVQTKGLTIGASGKLDLNDNELIVEYASAPFVAFDEIWGWILGGYSGELDPSKVGITSTTAQQTGGLTLLEIIDNTDVGFTEWPIGSGNTIPANAILGRYTYVGDTNWDGQVTPQDFTAVDSNLGLSQDRRIAVLVGDTNFDYQVTPQDYSGLDASLGLGVGNPLAAQAKRPLELEDQARDDLLSPIQ